MKKGGNGLATTSLSTGTILPLGSSRNFYLSSLCFLHLLLPMVDVAVILFRIQHGIPFFPPHHSRITLWLCPLSSFTLRSEKEGKRKWFRLYAYILRKGIKNKLHSIPSNLVVVNLILVQIITFLNYRLADQDYQKTASNQNWAV